MRRTAGTIGNVGADENEWVAFDLGEELLVSYYLGRGISNLG
jgi:hypothetical protein